MANQILPTTQTEATTATPATTAKTYTHRGYTLTLIDAGLTVYYEHRFVGETVGMSAANTLIDADVAQRKAALMKKMGRHENRATDLI